ncbi:MAG: hypothetical protein QMC80_08970, partial [Thermoplasmatales archaeon]|nr:hypothetical protein [Thermoplasmatales archaeon]
TKMVSLKEELITGKTVEIDYCEKCQDVYIPEKELKKYDEVKALKRKLAKALSIQSDKIDVLKDKNRLIIYQTA